MRTIVEVNNKVGPDDPRTYEAKLKKNGEIKVTIAPQIRPKAGPFVGMIDYDEHKIVFEDTINKDILETYEIFDELKECSTLVSASLSVDADYFARNKEYLRWPIEVYFVDKKTDTYIGSVNFGTPIGKIDITLYGAQVLPIMPKAAPAREEKPTEETL